MAERLLGPKRTTNIIYDINKYPANISHDIRLVPGKNDFVNGFRRRQVGCQITRVFVNFFEQRVWRTLSVVFILQVTITLILVNKYVAVERENTLLQYMGEVLRC